MASWGLDFEKNVYSAQGFGYRHFIFTVTVTQTSSFLIERNCFKSQSILDGCYASVDYCAGGNIARPVGKYSL